MVNQDWASTSADLSADDRNAVEMVRRGYSEGTRCLHFRVNFATFTPARLEAAFAAIQSIGPYNEFEPEGVIVRLRSLIDKGYEFDSIAVGREYSPVLYITAQRTHRDEAGVTVGVMTAMRDAEADEVDIERETTIRAWWD